MKEEFTWIETHKELVEYLKTKENSQRDLIALLKSVGITPFKDKDRSNQEIELEEIDPFTFFCYIYKYGDKKRLKILQEIAKKLNLPIPKDEKGIPSASPQKVWLFPYKSERTNEIQRLWTFFRKVMEDKIAGSDFEDVLSIKGVAKSKLTEALFYVRPERYLPINKPVKSYLKEILGLDFNFKTYSEYIELLKQIRSKTEVPFYELSYEAWKWSEGKMNYWIFQSQVIIYIKV